MKSTFLSAVCLAAALILPTNLSAATVDFSLEKIDGFEVVRFDIDNPSDTFVFTVRVTDQPGAKLQGASNPAAFNWTDITQTRVIGGNSITFTSNGFGARIMSNQSWYIRDALGASAIDWAFAAFEAEYTADLKAALAPNPAAVPLPAAGWLLFAGMAGLGLLRRTRA